MDIIKQEDFCDILSDTSSTGFDEKVSPYYDSSLPEINLQDLEFQIPEIFSSKNLEDNSLTYLCEICHKNVIKLEDPNSTRKKRKRSENQMIVASMKVCESCRSLDLEELKLLSSSAQCKRVIKREHAKRRAQENENLKNIRDEKQIDENQSLTESEKKKLKQVIRNRISAQQSRDRKKVYIKEIEKENECLKQQANNLKHKIQLLHQENQYLKTQLAKIHIGGPSTSGFKIATLGIATLLSVFILVNSLSETNSSTSIRQLSEKLNLNDFKNSEGISLQVMSEEVLETINKEVVLVPTKPNSIVEYRKQRVELINETKFLRKYEPCEKKIESSAMTTLFCPNVQAYWENESEANELKHLQVIIPLESLPIVEHTVVDTSGQKYMLEILCSVSDLKVLPISSN